MNDRIHVLYIDDEPDLLKVGKLFLEQYGNFTISTASGADEAIEFLRTNTVDVIISDYQMEEMTGTAFLRHLRSQGDNTLFILFTGRGREEVVIEALNGGADFYLQKEGEPKLLFMQLAHQILALVVRKRTEEALRFTRQSIDSSSETMVTIASDGHFVDVNDAFCKNSGYSRDELLSMAVHDIDPDYHEEIWSAYWAELKQRGTITFESSHRTKDGKTYPVEIKSTYFEYRGKEYQCAFARDITERKRADEEIAFKNVILTTEHESSPDGILIVDEQGKIISFNRKFVEIWSIPEEVIVTKSDELTLSSVLDNLPDPDVFLARVKHLYSHREEKSHEEIQLKDGRIIDRYSSPMFGENDRYYGRVWYFRDITERKRQEQELKNQYNAILSSEENLQQTKDYLENLISIANVPIIVWDPSLKITKTNHAFELLIGKPVEAVIGTSLETVLPSNNSESTARLIQTIREGVRWDATEIEIMHLDGSHRTLLWNSATLYASDGITPIATIAQGRDITEERRLEQEKERAIRQIQKNLTQLAMLNDGVRNPLTVINMSADMVDNTKVTDTIHDQIRQIDLMINQIDQRWIESEKILDYLHKHYQIDIPLSSDQEICKNTDYLSPEKNIPVVVDGQDELPPSPQGDIGHLTLADIINIPEIQLLLESFYSLTRMGVAIVDITGNILISTGWQDICAKFHRVNPESCNHCLESDTILTQGIVPGTSRLYRCKNNMWDFSTPIVIGGAHLGNLFIGQFLFDDEEVDYSLFRKQAKRYGFDEEAYIAALDKVLRWNRETVNTVMDLYSRFIHLVTQVSWSNIQLERTVHQRDSLLNSVQESEELLHTVVSNLHGVVFYVNKEGNFLLSEGKSLSGLGLMPGQVVGQSVFDVYRDVPEITEKISGVLSGTPWSGTIQVQDIIFDTVVSPVYDHQQNICGAVGVAADVTEQTQMEEARVFLLRADYLKIGEDFFRSLARYLAETLHMDYVCIDRLEGDMLTAQTVAVYYDGEFEPNVSYTLHDTPCGEVVGKRICIFPRDVRNQFTKDLVLQEMKAECYVGTTLWSFDGNPIGLIAIIGRKPLENTHLAESILNLVAVRAAGELERILAEDALRRSEEWHRAIVSALPDVFFILNNQGVFLSCLAKNPDTLLMPIQAFIGKSVSDVLPPTIAHQALTAISNALNTGELQIFEYYLDHSDGQRWYEIRMVRSTSYEVLAILRDITERKFAEEALRQSNQKLRLLTSLTRHDIFNQISAVQLLQDMALNSSNLTKIHEYISRARQAGEMIEKTIGFTREYEDFGIVTSCWQQVHHIIELATTEVSLGNVGIDNRIPEDLEVYADPIVRKVFVTLMENTVRHGGLVSTIRFFCQPIGDSLALVCTDDGIGIPHDEKELIFNHGYGKHTGIGLFLAREILSITGFSIRECGIPGEGARFEILVPPGKFRSKVEIR